MTTPAVKPKKALVIPDPQVPFEAPEAINAMLEYAERNRPWDYVVLLGDFMDLDSVSRYVDGYPGDTAGRKLREDYEWGNYWLDRIEKAVGRVRGEKAFIMGNHDVRAERFVARFPQLEGMIEVAPNLRLAERKWRVVRSYPDGETYKIGKLHFHHGRYCNKYHAAKHAMEYGTNIVYGHVHDVQSYSQAQLGRGHIIEAQSLGCLCNLEQAYIGKNPTNWSHAFGVAHFRPNGMYNMYVTRIFDGQFVGLDGRFYDGRGKKAKK